MIAAAIQATIFQLFFLGLQGSPRLYYHLRRVATDMQGCVCARHNELRGFMLSQGLATSEID